MPSRITPLVSGQIYHIYNRGSEKRPIFGSRRDYQRFLKTIRYYQLEGPKPKLSNFTRFHTFKPDLSKKIVEVLAFCLMPNHFHFLIKQIKDGGITEFISKLSNSYTKYYNTKYSRIGPLFQGEFKSVIVEDDEQLVHLSRYIHLNPISSLLVKNLNQYEWSSFKEYLDNVSEGICNKHDVLGFFKSPKDYIQFILDQVDHAQKLEVIKHKLIE
ncbi:transposase [Candidatus Daviesbacteria bacterium]|nr:transposase [Candidatus Daviesbacteria bacterium]